MASRNWLRQVIKRSFTTAADNRYTLQVGIEVHARALAQTKLFSDSLATAADVPAPPNSRVALFDAAIPGTLPSLNEECIDQAIRTGLALGAKIEPISMFERKHYYYCDLPHGFQITQQRAPIVTGGVVELELPDSGVPAETSPASTAKPVPGEEAHSGMKRTVRIRQVQLEQDSGKSAHEGDCTKVDLNRAGACLMEIVSEPDIQSAEEASLFVKQLQSLLRHIGTCDGNMESGSLRADVNISVSDLASGRRTQRVEIKNLNSLRSIRRAVEHEHRRLARLLGQGGYGAGPLPSETRAFDADTGTTSLLRTKERGLDYRFLPEPDLPVLKLSAARVQRVAGAMPELPREAERRLTSPPWSLSRYHARLLLEHPGGVRYLEAAAAGGGVEQVTNWVCNELLGRVNGRGLTLAESPVAPEQVAGLLALARDGKVAMNNAKKVLKMLTEAEHEGKDPMALVKEMGWEQVAFGEEELREMVERVVLDPSHAGEVEKFKKGKKRIVGFFVGKVMAETSGSAPPKTVSQMVMQALNRL